MSSSTSQPTLRLAFSLGVLIVAMSGSQDDRWEREQTAEVGDERIVTVDRRTGYVLPRAPPRKVDTWVWLGDVPIVAPKPQPMTEYEQMLASSRVFAANVDDSEQHLRRNRFLEKRQHSQRR